MPRQMFGGTAIPVAGAAASSGLRQRQIGAA
jgi:hypothetical protein